MLYYIPTPRFEVARLRLGCKRVYYCTLLPVFDLFFFALLLREMQEIQLVYGL